MDQRIIGNMDGVVISILLLVFIPTSTIMISHNYFATAILAYSKPNQVNSNITDSLDIYNISEKKCM